MESRAALTRASFDAYSLHEGRSTCSAVSRAIRVNQAVRRIWPDLKLSLESIPIMVFEAWSLRVRDALFGVSALGAAQPSAPFRCPIDFKALATRSSTARSRGRLSCASKISRSLPRSSRSARPPAGREWLLPATGIGCGPDCPGKYQVTTSSMVNMGEAPKRRDGMKNLPALTLA